LGVSKIYLFPQVTFFYRRERRGIAENAEENQFVLFQKPEKTSFLGVLGDTSALSAVNLFVF